MTPARVGTVFATLLGLAGLLVIVPLVADIGLAVGRVGQANPLVWLAHRAAGAVSLGTNGLFTLPSPTMSVAVNRATAVLLWLAIVALVRTLARSARRAAVDGRRPRRRDPSSGARRVPRASRILFTAVAVLATLETAGFAGAYFLYSRHYVYTDNATVDGDKIEINAPTDGTVTDWSIHDGSAVRSGQVVGRIREVGSGGRPEWLVKAPDAGTVAADDVVDGTYVTAGTNLATAYDLAGLYVTARVKDTEIGQVHPGAPVDIRVDAFPNIDMAGVVSVVQSSAAGQFTIFPAPGTADPTNPQKVDQYVPVRIVFTSTGGARLEPGMNVAVHIRKQ